MKEVSQLTVEDIKRFPVWEFVNEEEYKGKDVMVQPVQTLPVTDLGGRLVGCHVTLRNGDRHWAIVGNVDLASFRKTHHFLTASFENHGKWFQLARYFDFDWSSRGSVQFADFLGLPIEAVFPISYDISGVASGVPESTKGMILSEPREKLSRDQIMALIFE